MARLITEAFDDRSPAWVLRHATDDTDRAAVLASAGRFVVE